ncbi:MAG TPA: BatA domain-containing protein [Cyclobacteriaceae bacterium]|nr:BatA domain-containing protein [Cyclobacteriaceae bacterium]
MSLANPILLWSLLGLSVPIAIHLLSRKDGQVIRLGSIRHVQETSTQQFKGIKWNELLLLAIRCTLIFIFCLFLSGLTCTGVSKQKWVVVEAGFENDSFVKPILDSLVKEGYEQHQLAEGFPTARHDSVFGGNYWALLNQLGEKKPANAVVLSSSRFENFRGKRTPLPVNINWIAVPVNKIDFPVEAIKLDDDSLFVRTGHSSFDQTSFTAAKVKSLGANSISSPDPVRVMVISEAKYAYDRKILMACLKVIQKTFPFSLTVLESNSATPPEKSDWIIRLSDFNASEKISGSSITMRPGSSANVIDQVGSTEWVFTKRLNEEVAIDQNLTIELAHLIVPSRKQHEIARLNDRRAMPDALIRPALIQSKAANVITSSASSPLIICLVLLLLVERIIAYRRNQ